MNGVLVDTDVLIAAYRTDPADARVRKAKDALEELARSGSGCLSLQNLVEFARVVTDPARTTPPVAPSRVREAIGRLCDVFDVLKPSAATVEAALIAAEKHRLPFRDSMLWAVAHENGIGEVLTEDLPGPAQIEGVRYRNPLA